MGARNPQIPDNETNRAKIAQAASILEGSCRSVDDVLQQVFEDEHLSVVDIDTTLLQLLDDQVLECQGCNWWFETGDIDDDTLCPECASTNAAND